jgi:hypothetical protein
MNVLVTEFQKCSGFHFLSCAHTTVGSMGYNYYVTNQVKVKACLKIMCFWWHSS